jgi:hypothetical protein
MNKSSHVDQLGHEIRVGDVVAYKGEFEVKVGRVRSLQVNNAYGQNMATVTVKQKGNYPARTVDAHRVVVLCDAAANAFGVEHGELVQTR